MIDEECMIEMFGYTSDDLPPQSRQPVLAICDGCGKYRVVPKYGYRCLCNSCAQKGKVRTDAQRKAISVGIQGTSVNEWDGFAREQKYCPKFNNSCRERSRDKYGRRCFLCGKDETENGKRLSVHHVDMSKSQGCDGEEWKLVPLCHSCHSSAHTKIWTARIEYLLSNGKTKPLNMMSDKEPLAQMRTRR